MKKNLKIFVFLICLCPLILLTACTPPEKFLISALPSDSSLGSVQGVLTEKKEEGSKITLTAKENNSENNPFICWVKDYKTVVSNTKRLNLTYNSSSAGHYTAIFEEDSSSKMMFSCLSKIDFQPAGYTTINYEIYSALITSGSDEYAKFINGSYTIGSDSEVDKMQVIYFGGVGVNNEYKFKVNLKMLDVQGMETQYEFQINSLLNRNNFEGENCTISHHVSDFNADISLTFEKLTFGKYN